MGKLLLHLAFTSMGVAVFFPFFFFYFNYSLAEMLKDGIELCCRICKPVCSVGTVVCIELTGEVVPLLETLAVS